MDARIVIIFTFVLLGMSNTLTSVPIRQVSRFKKISCSDPNIAPIHLLDPLTVRSEPCFHRCAFLCDRTPLCTYAIFLDDQKRCQLLSTTDDFAPSSLYDTKDNCMVLKKLTDVTSPQCSAVDTWKTATGEDIMAAEDADILSMKLYRTNTGSVRITPVGSLLVDDFSRYIATSHGYLSVNKEDRAFADPYRFGFMTFVEKGTETFTAKIDKTGNLGGRISTSTDPSTYLRMRHTEDDPTGKPSTIHVYTTVDIVKSLSMGYRRIERSPTRIEIAKDGDVHFDRTGTFAVNSTGQMVSPIYLTSVKESLKSGMRYELRHQPFTGTSLPARVTHAPKAWKMDTCWTKLQPRNQSETVLDVLNEAVTDGRDIRILLANATISTDVLSISIYLETTVFTLAPYLTPFKGADILGSTKHIRFSVLGTSGSLVGCEWTLDSTTEREYDTVYNSIEYYSSSRQWTRVMRRNSSEVTLGSHKSLHNTVMNGTNIRLCFTRAKNTVQFCYAPIHTLAVSEDNIIFQSSSDLSYVRNQEDGNPERLFSGCSMIYKMVSSQGWVKVSTMTQGVDKVKELSWDISDIIFFAEL